MAIFRRRPSSGASNAGGVGTNRNSGRTVGYRSMTALVRDQQLTVVSAIVYNSYGDVCLRHRSPRISEYAEEKKREQNLFCISTKSEAEVNNNRRLR